MRLLLLISFICGLCANHYVNGYLNKIINSSDKTKSHLDNIHSKLISFINETNQKHITNHHRNNQFNNTNINKIFAEDSTSDKTSTSYIAKKSGNRPIKTGNDAAETVISTTSSIDASKVGSTVSGKHIKTSDDNSVSTVIQPTISKKANHLSSESVIISNQNKRNSIPKKKRPNAMISTESVENKSNKELTDRLSKQNSVSKEVSRSNSISNDNKGNSIPMRKRSDVMNSMGSVENESTKESTDWHLKDVSESNIEHESDANESDASESTEVSEQQNLDDGHSTTSLPTTTSRPTTTEQAKHIHVTHVVNWDISYNISSDTNQILKGNKDIIYHLIKFNSFECKEVRCKCIDIDINIKIEDIERELHHIKCNKLFRKKFDIQILPNVEYIFEITPNVEFLNVDPDEMYILGKEKIFAIKKDIKSVPAIIGSYELLIIIRDRYYDSLNVHSGKEVSKILSYEISQLEPTLGMKFLSILVYPPSRKHKLAKIYIVLQSTNSNAHQITLERIQNLYYDNSPLPKSMLSGIVRNHVLMNISSVTSLKKDKVIDSMENEMEEAAIGSNYGAIFLCGIIMAICLFFIVKSSDTNKIKYLFNEFCRKCIILIQMIITNQSFRSQQRVPDYGMIGNISDDLDIADVEIEEDGSGIKLMNTIYEEENIPPFRQEKYTKILKDNWLTTMQQLKQLNNKDWDRLGFDKEIQDAIAAKLLETDDSLKSLEELSYPKKKKIRAITEDTISETSFSDF